MSIRKNIPYYFLAIFGIIFLSLIGDLALVGRGDKVISVLKAVMRLPTSALKNFSSASAFHSHESWMVAEFLPLIVSVTSAVQVYSEKKSRFDQFYQIRSGRRRFYIKRLTGAALSGLLITGTAIFLYAAWCAWVFPLNASVDSDMTYTWSAYVQEVTQEGICLSLYGMAMSALTSAFVMIFPNLYVCLSLLFLLSYILRNAALDQNYLVPVIIMSAAVIVYGINWKVRWERL